MADTKLSALSALSAGPAETDEFYIRDVSEAAADESKRITAVELLNPENFTAVTLPAATDELFINDAGVGKKITHDDLLFGANGTPSTQAHSDAAAIGTALDAARSDHKHAMPAAGGGPSQSDQAALEAETNENTYAPPDLIKHSPGVAKGWCHIAAAGTLNTPNYNVASVTDTGVGDRTVVWDIDFSTAVYAASVDKEGDDGFSIDVPSATYAVGSLRVVAYQATLKVDIVHTVTVHGDQ